MLFNVKDGIKIYETIGLGRCNVTKLLKFNWRWCFSVQFFLSLSGLDFIWNRLIRFVINQNRKLEFCKMCYALMVTFYQSNVNNLENYLIILFFCCCWQVVKLVSYNRYTMHFIVWIGSWSEIYLKLFKKFNFRKREFCLNIFSFFL